MARYDLALEFQEPLMSEPAASRFVSHRRKALLRAGRLDEALALTKKVAFAENISAPEIQQRHDELRRCYVGLQTSTAVDVQHFRFLQKRVKETMVVSDFVKRMPTSGAYASFYQGIQKRLNRPTAMLEWIDAGYADVRGEVRLGALVGLPLFYKYNALRKLGKGELGLSQLRDAQMFFFREPYFYAHYKQQYRSLVEGRCASRRDRALVLILSCRKNLELARLLSLQLEQNTDLDHLLLIADPSLLVPKLDGRLLTVPGEDTYEGLPNKIARAFEYVALATNWTGVVKIDDDTFIEDFDRFSRLMTDLVSEAHDYVGEWDYFGDPTYHFGKCSNPELQRKPALHAHTRYCYGKGYYVSWRALERFAEVILRYPRYLALATYEDVMVGEVLTSVGIRPTYELLERRGTIHIDICEGIEHMFEQDQTRQTR